MDYQYLSQSNHHGNEPAIFAHRLTRELTKQEAVNELSIKIDVPDNPDRGVNNTEDWTEDNNDWEERGMLSQ